MLLLLSPVTWRLTAPSLRYQSPLWADRGLPALWLLILTHVLAFGQNWCRCEKGVWGIDCSLGAEILGPKNSPNTAAGVRPLIYVYEMPPRFTTCMHLGTFLGSYLGTYLSAYLGRISQVARRVPSG